MKSVEEQLKDYIEILEGLHKVAEKESKEYDHFESLRYMASGEEMVLRKVIAALKNIK
ncbi:hypothetical protein Plant_30 [Bacillus phage poppyseed]|uniref:Uncharacterized protein n=5 Tax=Pagevirus TaxID=1921184 RepID=A0A0A0RNM8_9CAUD|nr:hypothetical protein Page_30 [Bacillus phage Page]YP_008771348.1 hypothetical protein Pony_30 [Bacillus phage Pony]YP_009152829.1 hypothetical protein CPT_Pookie30 [Bacillus phage Pookie]YP_009210066.1 hypothetical protein AVV20_gp31 [Bacillus phage Palmer]AGY48047.1 hypothetical protein Plant_30 [Bacillus phage poppyseed]AGY47952.1 hypothetical protein Page_30 [Bacillus phage Page]AGY48271.1 hypothetical protein Pony_30 [Bacillus phage Pony]AIW03715.1 hypothetical protein CPT_Pookie30 [B